MRTCLFQYSQSLFIVWCHPFPPFLYSYVSPLLCLLSLPRMCDPICSPSLEHPCMSTFCVCITGTSVLTVSPHVYPLHFCTFQWLLWLSRVILFRMVLPQVLIVRMVVPWLVLTSFQFNDGFRCLRPFSLKVLSCILPTYHHPSVVSQVMRSPFSKRSASTCVLLTSLVPSFWL